VAYATRGVICWVCCSLGWPGAEVFRASIGVRSHLIALQVDRIFTQSCQVVGCRTVLAQWLVTCLHLGWLLVYTITAAKQAGLVLLRRHCHLLLMSLAERCFLALPFHLPVVLPCLLFCVHVCVCMIMCGRGVSGCMFQCEEWAATEAAFGLFGAAMCSYVAQI